MVISIGFGGTCVTHEFALVGIRMKMLNKPKTICKLEKG